MGSLINKAKNKLAFTLAEVLITLGIIGIVAALISVLLIGLSYNFVVEKLLTSQMMSLINFKLLGFSELFNLIIVVYLVLGVGVGTLGSVISMRKYLKV